VTTCENEPVTTGEAHDTAQWGRVADDGTVYVRTSSGERVIGSWKAGDTSAALAFYGLRYADLETEVGLLETRFSAGKADAAHTRASATRIRESLATASVIGDIDALERRLAALLEAVAAKAEEDKAARAARAAEAVDRKRALVDEAEQLAESTHWKVAGDRLREIATTWRDIRIDRKTDGELWARLRTARGTFAQRRSAHFATLGEERAAAKRVKEKLVAEAEGLAASTDWKPTASRLKALMREWKAAPRADRESEAEFWTRFRAAQDQFFNRLGEQNAERDVEFRSNQERKEALAAEAEAIDVTDLDAAQSQLRSIQERWEAAGKVPRDAVAKLDDRLAAVARKVRDAADARWREASVASSPLVIRLRESVGKLESKIVRARAAGREDEAAEAEATLATQREWLAQAENA
jgi:hypothetical protein